MKENIIRLEDDQQKFIQKQLDMGLRPTVISRAFHRRFGTTIRPQEIEDMRTAVVQVKAPRKDVEEIKAKLGSHDQQLEYVRAKLRQRIDDDDITNNDLVNLSKELRQNITASQQLASMNDDRGQTQYILVYGDTIQQTSPDADIQDVDFEVYDGT